MAVSVEEAERMAFETELLKGYELDHNSCNVLWTHYKKLSLMKKAGSMAIAVGLGGISKLTAGAIPNPVDFAKNIKSALSTKGHINQLVKIEDYVTCQCQGKSCEGILSYIIEQKEKKLSKRTACIVSFFFPPAGYPAKIYGFSRAVYKRIKGIKGTERTRVAQHLYDRRHLCNMAKCAIVEVMGKERAAPMVYSAGGFKEKRVRASEDFVSAIADHLRSA